MKRIKRVQSLYLLLATISCVMSLKMNAATYVGKLQLFIIT